MTIREGKWKCTYCEAVNRGRDLKCAGCGATRERDVSFFVEEEAPEVSDEGLLNNARQGPEWMCETCGASNESARAACRNCGAPRGQSVNREVRDILPPSPPPPPARAGRRLAIFGGTALAILVGGLLLLAALAFYLTRSHETDLTIAEVEWQRSVEVEELQTVTEQAWEGEVPADARVVSSRRELFRTDRIQTGTRPVEQRYTERVQTGTRRVKVGTRDLGNGFFEDIYRDEPVYETRERTRTVQEPIYRNQPVYRNRITYQAERWRPVNTLQAQGMDNAPRWPEVNEGQRRRARERAGRYVVRLRDPATGKTYEQETTEADFPRFAPGRTARARINNLGRITELTPPT